MLHKSNLKLSFVFGIVKLVLVAESSYFVSRIKQIYLVIKNVEKIL